MYAMEPRELLQLLMERDGVNSNSLAARLDNATTQPQIHKYLSGKAKEPRRATLAPVAAHFRIPLDALYDPLIADAVAKEKQLISPSADDVQVDMANAVVQTTKPLSELATALALMYDNLPNDETLRTARLRKAVDALLGIERPTSSQRKSAAPAAASKEKRPA